jgi:Ca-activated chloride channel family protein
MRFAAEHNQWLLLLVPMVAWFAVWALRRRRRDLERLAHADVAERLTRTVSRPRQQIKSALVVGGIGLLILALTGPQFGIRLEMAERRGVDVVVVLDVSRSMLAEDVRPNRLQRARRAIHRLMDGLEGDRVALVVFAANAYVQCPLTLDISALRMLLGAVDVDAIPSQGTSLARALDRAAHVFDEGDQQHKVVVVFSDGEAHAGDAATAAGRLAEEGARVFCVGIGSSDGELIPLRADDGTHLDYHKDRDGNYVKSRLDETSLRDVAAAGEGAYWRNSLTAGELDELADRIAGVEEKELGSERFTRYEERYQIPLALALVCFLTEGLLSERSRSRREWRGRFA